MKHLRVTKLCKDNLLSTRPSVRRSAGKSDAASDGGRMALSKWQRVAAGRKAQRTESEDVASSYAEKKDSADEREHIQLRQIESYIEPRKDYIVCREMQRTNVNMDKDNSYTSIDDNVKNLADNNDEIYVENISNERTENDADMSEVNERGVKTRKKAVLWQRNPSFKSKIDGDNLSQRNEQNKRKRPGETLVRNSLIHAVNRTNDSNDRVTNKEEGRILEKSASFEKEDKHFVAEAKKCCQDDSDNSDFSLSESCLVNLFCENCREENVKLLENGRQLTRESERIRTRSEADKEQEPSSNRYIHENPIFNLEKQVPSPESPVIYIPDDYFPCSDSHDRLESRKSSDSTETADTSHDTLDIIEKGGATEKEHLKLKKDSIASCGSFELLSESQEVLNDVETKGQGEEKLEIEQGSNESFTIVLPDGNQMQITQV